MLSTASTAQTTRTSLAGGRGGVHGTPEYMSPEQMLGRDVDERSDVFSLGVVLYEMATGRRPLTRADRTGPAIGLTKRLPRADAIEPSVPRVVADVIAKALEVDPEERFTTAAELGSALEAIERQTGAATTGRATAHGAPLRRTILRTAAVMVLVPIVLLCLGLVNSAAFNVTLQRRSPFNSEPLQAYVVWGLRSLVAPLFYMTATVLVVMAVRFVIRVLSLFKPIGRHVANGRARLRRLTSTAGFDDPIVVAQAIATLGVVALSVVMWRYWGLFHACVSMITTNPPAHFALIRPENAPFKSSYGIVLDVLIVAFGAGLLRVVRLRTEQGVRHGAGTMMVGIAILTLLVLMNEVPYRILWHNQFERIDVAGTRCYVIGEHADEWLVYCPEMDQPRNRIIARTDPAARRTGVVESIFTTARR
jgi:hypothetical protein